MSSQTDIEEKAGDEPEKVRFNMWLRPGVYNDFKRVARHQGRSMSDIARQLIFEFLDKQKER